MKTLTGNPLSLAEEACEEIRERAYIQVTLFLEANKLKEAAESYLAFLTLPFETKQSFKIQSNLGGKPTSLGYIRRTKKSSVDNKEFFHYNPLAEKSFTENPNYLLSEVSSFLTMARLVNQAATTTLKNILSIISEKYPEVSKEYSLNSLSERTILRFLKYDVEGAGNFLAHGHYDAGGCTLALAESAPGLRLGRTDKDLVQVKHEPGAAIFMPALYFHTVTDHLFHPVWHDVVQLSEDTLSDSVARWSIVFFADGISQKNRPTDEEVYKPREFFK